MRSSTALPTNGKLYVFGGWDGGKARGVAYQYDPVTDKWTKKTSMPRLTHHAALAAANGKIYAMGGFIPPKDTAIPVGGAWEAHCAQRVGVHPAADSWKSLPPLPGKRGSAIAAEVGGKIYVIGGATTTEGSKDPYFTFFGPSRVLAPTRCTTPPPTSGRPARRCRCHVTTHSAASSTARSTSSAAAPATGSSCRRRTPTWWKSTTRSRHVERAEGTDAHRSKRGSVGV